MKRPLSLPPELAAKYKSYYRQSLLNKKDYLGNQLLTDAEADALVMELTDNSMGSLFDDGYEYFAAGRR